MLQLHHTDQWSQSFRRPQERQLLIVVNIIVRLSVSFGYDGEKVAGSKAIADGAALQTSALNHN
jgi:hypothetical protein